MIQEILLAEKESEVGLPRMVGGVGGVEGHRNSFPDLDLADDDGIGSSEGVGAGGGRCRRHGGEKGG